MSENEYSRLFSAITEAIVDLSENCFKGKDYYWFHVYDMTNSSRTNSYLILFDYALKNADIKYLYKLKELIMIDKRVSDFNEDI